MSGLGYLERVALFAEEVLTQPAAQGYSRVCFLISVVLDLMHSKRMEGQVANHSG